MLRPLTQYKDDRGIAERQRVLRYVFAAIVGPVHAELTRWRVRGQSCERSTRLHLLHVRVAAQRHLGRCFVRRSSQPFRAVLPIAQSILFVLAKPSPTSSIHAVAVAVI